MSYTKVYINIGYPKMENEDELDIRGVIVIVKNFAQYPNDTHFIQLKENIQDTILELEKAFTIYSLTSSISWHILN